MSRVIQGGEKPDNRRLRKMEQADRYSSPWSFKARLKVFAWQIVWWFLFRPTPKHLIGWRLWLLRRFGCRMNGRPWVDASAIIKMPWQLTLEDHACLGPRSEVYNLGHVTLRAGCTISQQAYLCGGTHDFESERLELLVGDIEIGEDAFVGARAFILPGIQVGERAIVGACAVVTRDVPSGTVVAGNPAKVIGPRPPVRE